MNTYPQARLAAERDLIHQGSQRLLDGTPQQSDGKLTIATIATFAIEAGISRQ